MKLSIEGITDRDVWEHAGITLPSYDVPKLYDHTRTEPQWLHFGIGNIFRNFVGGIADRLIAEGYIDTGITCAESFDFEIVDRIYRPFDNLTISAILNNDGTTDKKVLAPFGEVVKADFTNAAEWKRLMEIFTAPSLQMVSFTITEKGYSLTGLDGNYTKAAQRDIELGPAKATGVIAIVTAMLFARYQNGAVPISLVSMDNCSHNGRRLQEAVWTISDEWEKREYVNKGFSQYIHDASKVTFPWTMIDKITPRPSEKIAELLKGLGIEGIDPIETDKKTFIAPFSNAERIQYLVIEDDFPNGRPPLEKAGVYMTDRETVDKSEKMKVNTCLNPIHTALCTYDCMLGYELFADGLGDPELAKLADRIGYVEGLPVVENPGIISPKAFLDEVLQIRMSNPYLGDTSQRIAVDISQMVGIRFGETIKSYVRKYGSAERLTGIALAIAGWLRYLLELDDQGKHFNPAPDPMIPELQKYLKGVRFGKPESLDGQLHPILSNANVFGSDLYSSGIGTRIERMFCEEIQGPGAVRETLKKYLS